MQFLLIVIFLFGRQVEYKGDTFIELEDLLNGFNDPCVMDVKMGSRTFLESEVSRTAARQDLYQKVRTVRTYVVTCAFQQRNLMTAALKRVRVELYFIFKFTSTC